MAPPQTNLYANNSPYIAPSDYNNNYAQGFSQPPPNFPSPQQPTQQQQHENRPPFQNYNLGQVQFNQPNQLHQSQSAPNIVANVPAIDPNVQPQNQKNPHHHKPAFSLLHHHAPSAPQNQQQNSPQLRPSSSWTAVKSASAPGIIKASQGGAPAHPPPPTPLHHSSIAAKFLAAVHHGEH